MDMQISDDFHVWMNAELFLRVVLQATTRIFNISGIVLCMEEKLLLAISFILALAGILGLFFLSQGLEYDTSSESGVVALTGEVVSFRNSGNTTFISLLKPEIVDVVVFSNVSMVKGEKIEVIGEEDDKGIVARRIRSVD